MPERTNGFGVIALIPKPLWRSYVMEVEATAGSLMQPTGNASSQYPLERLLARTMVVTRLLAIIGGMMIVAVGFMICFEILLRSFSISLGVTDEISNYALAIGSALAFSHCLVERAHIRIDSATRFLSLKIRIAIDLIAILTLAGFYLVVSWYAVETAMVSFRRGARSLTELQTPLFIPQGLWALALILFVVIGVIIFLAACGRILRGDIDGAQELIATKSEDLQSEAHL
jgi:TRAP-type C4-dicarboxylate transport system permease small subunit